MIQFPCHCSSGYYRWEAKQRQIDLTIERAFKGGRIVAQNEGWITVRPVKGNRVINGIVRLKILDDKELVVEMEDRERFDNLKKKLSSIFGNQIDVELK